jgi:NADH-quinone oxidoreductase subunit M
MDFDLTFNRYLFFIIYSSLESSFDSDDCFQHIIAYFFNLFAAWIEFNKSTGKLQFMSKLPSVLDSYAGFEYDQYGTLNFIVELTGYLFFSFYWQPFNTSLYFGGMDQHSNVSIALLFLLLETLMIAAFCVLICFFLHLLWKRANTYVFNYRSVGIWKKSQSSVSIILYTLIGSLLMLLAILLIYCQTGTTNLEILYAAELVKVDSFCYG